MAYKKTSSGLLVPSDTPVKVKVRAKYDAAQTNTDNSKHWANSDSLSANAANSPSVRATLRKRARYEIANNSYAKGIVTTLANDLIGTGPRLQMLTPNPELNKSIEKKFNKWADEIDLARKLRTMKMAKVGDGEGFGILTNNPNLLSPVKLDLRLVEADQIATPWMLRGVESYIDGIELDKWGNPKRYYVLKNHPGDTSGVGNFDDYFEISVDYMVHWFRMDRPGQARGVPEITPALPLFAQLRRYTLAVIAAAETAADFAAVIQSKNAPDTNDTDFEAMDVLELEKRMATMLPAGYELGQLKAEQPTTTYDMFKKEILNEIARALNVPFNIAAGNSSGYNYASGRLDHQTYYKSVRVEQDELALLALDKIFTAWLYEASLVDDIPLLADAPHQWFWDGTEHVDPQKEANAQSVRLLNHTTTYAAEFAKQGKDWETELQQAAKELELMKKLGLTVAEQPKEQPKEEEEDE
jgi:lambda family phage portal protein